MTCDHTQVRRPRRSVLRLASGLTLLSIGTIVGGSPAHAAPIALTDVELDISPSTVTIGGATDVTTEFAGCVPDTAVEGDTVELELPADFTNWPAGFDVNAGADTVFDVTISNASPAVATFTLTAEGAAIDNLCFTSFFLARWSGTDAGTVPLEYSINGVAVLDPPELTVNAGPTGLPPTQVSKSSYFNGTQQCRDSATNCLFWFFNFPVGDIGPITLTDTAQPGWTFACGSVRYRLVTFSDYPASGPRINGPFITTPGDVTWTCSPDSFVASIDTSNLEPNQMWRVDVGANVDTASGIGGVTYNNVAEAVVGGDPQTTSRSAQSAFVGGLAQGDRIDIEKFDDDDNDADVEDEAVVVDGDTTLRFLIANTGTTDLVDVVVSDQVLAGAATMNDLTCAFPDGSAGTTWAGPFASGSQFTCTATLTGVIDTHQNRATVTATGNDEVTDADDYWARPTPSVSVGDYVWWDEDENGVQDDGEPGIAGVTLTLTGPDGNPVVDVFGNPVDPVQTDGDGLYGFGDLPVLEPGQSYTVTVTDPDGFTPTVAGVGDSGTDSSTGSAASTDLTIDGANDPTLDFGYVPTPGVTPPTTVAPTTPTTVAPTTPPTTDPTAPTTTVGPASSPPVNPPTAAPTTTVAPEVVPLPATGGSTGPLVALALGLVAAGWLALGLSRRRPRPTS